MPNVIDIEPKGGKAALLHLEDGSAVWTPEIDKAKGLLGHPIPPDWTQRQGEYGPQAFPPRERKGGGGGNTAWRNTKEGFEAEQRGRLAWQREDEDRKDRRTALMQAVSLAPAINSDFNVNHIAELASDLYAWLRDGQARSPESSSPDDGRPTSEKGSKAGKGKAGTDPSSAGEEGPVSSVAGPSYPKSVNECLHLSGLNEQDRCTDCGLPGEKVRRLQGAA